MIVLLNLKISSLFLLLFVIGCASPADMNSMVVSKSPSERINLPPEIKGAFTINRVGGGEETNPLWTSEVDNTSFRGAFERSLDATGLLGGINTAKYSIEADLKNLEQPLFGLDFTLTSTVNYVVRNLKNKDVWFDKNITSSFTATISDAFAGITRLKLANEGSIRENISTFIDEMIQQAPKQKQ